MFAASGQPMGSFDENSDDAAQAKRVRPHVIYSKRHFPRPSTGRNAVRLVVSKDALQNDDTLSTLVDENARTFTWAGRDKRILVHPVNFDKQFNVTYTHPVHLSNEETSDDDSASAAAIAYNQKASSTLSRASTANSIQGNPPPRAGRPRMFQDMEADGHRRGPKLESKPHGASW
ncbi:hypothetical protein K432DRAFT_400126 [Lepidopterella palustris CBS 459.81]|uniref:Uncharacterized protein n=1 Tax=Lepidopterella palustris CBS 459.81 TaxID=1314670 RepID=A0A8E2EKP2_9PEZI|nr:hypothetical protein K432DRAFT_400126 [Lepidopterella palustris CBS 459.81]